MRTGRLDHIKLLFIVGPVVTAMKVKVGLAGTILPMRNGMGHSKILWKHEESKNL